MAKQNGNGTLGNSSEAGSDGSEFNGKIKFRPIIVDPTELDSGTETGGNSAAGSGNSGEPRKRGRPKGTGTGSRNSGSSKASAALDVDGLSAIFLSTHQLLAALSKTPALAIDDFEAKSLARGVANVGRHYNMKSSEKALDWFNLIQALALVYGTRIFAMRDKFKRAPKTTQGSDNLSNRPPEPPINQGVMLDANGNILQ